MTRAGLNAIVVATVLVTAAHAEPLPVRHELPTALAEEAVSAAVSKCAADGDAVAATIVDKEGTVRAVLRDQEAPPNTLDSSRGKAYAAVTLGKIFKLRTTSEILERLKGKPAAPALNGLPGMMIAPGGVVIMVGDGEVIAAIGVGGGPDGARDEECAKAGLAKIVSRLR